MSAASAGNDVERRLRGLVRKGPPPGLRARVMVAAAPNASRPGPADRLWYSRTARWAYALCVVLVVLADPVTSSLRRDPVPMSARDDSAARVAEALELRADERDWIELSLGRIERLARRGRSDTKEVLR